MKLLYEPVAVRHAVYFFLPEVPQLPGQTIGDSEKVRKEMPSRNTRTGTLFRKQYVASAGESEEIQIKGEKLCKEKRETRCYHVSFV